jgi:hypothetical protein
MKYKLHVFFLILCPLLFILVLRQHIIEGYPYYGLPVTGFFGPFSGFDYPGNDIASYNMSAPECMKKCSTTKGCAGVITSDQDNCWLKYKFTGKISKDNRNVYYNYDGIPYQDVERGVDYWGNDIGENYESIDVDDCKKICNTKSNCAGIVVSPSKSCWLKTDFSNKSSNRDRNTYKKGFQ